MVATGGNHGETWRTISSVFSLLPRVEIGFNVCVAAVGEVDFAVRKQRGRESGVVNAAVRPFRVAGQLEVGTAGNKYGIDPTE